MPEIENRENGAATENETATEAKAESTTESPANGGSSNLSRGVKTALIATAVGTAVAAATRAHSGSSPTGGGGEGAGSGAAGGVKERFDRASKRGEPFFTAAWDAGKDSFEPLTRHGARQAGRFLAQRSPDFVRETIIPPFVEGLTEDQDSSS